MGSKGVDWHINEGLQILNEGRIILKFLGSDADVRSCLEDQRSLGMCFLGEKRHKLMRF